FVHIGLTYLIHFKFSCNSKHINKHIAPYSFVFIIGTGIICLWQNFNGDIINLNHSHILRKFYAFMKQGKIFIIVKYIQFSECIKMLLGKRHSFVLSPIVKRLMFKNLNYFITHPYSEV